MTERPICFNEEMVRAILDGRKTQTRRPAPIEKLDITHYPDCGIAWGVHFTKPIHGSLGYYSGGNFTEQQARSIIASQFGPFGVPGDRLWVRETWGLECVFGFSDGKGKCESTYVLSFKAAGEDREIDWEGNITDTDPYLRLADTQRGDWRPSIHMPRWASRITLEVTGVRVERLLDITEADAKAEGFESVAAFFDLWDSIYAAKGLGRETNPWVWVVEFKRVEEKK